MNHYIMDYETLVNCFVAVFKHYKTGELHVFSVCELQNDLDEYIKFLNKNKKNKEWHISYNGLAFDAQITHYILKNEKHLKSLSGSVAAYEIYLYAQETIGKSNRHEFLDLPEWHMVIGQIDVFKLNHWDNPAKRSSLKWIQFSMDWENLLDMPIHHETRIETQKQLDIITTYCINDVESTEAIYKRSKSDLQLRLELSKKYNLNLVNASEPRISKELFAYYLSKELKIPKYELKKLRTYREIIRVKDIILPYTKFKTPEFQLLLDKFNTVELDPECTKGSFKYSVNYKGVKTDFGLGGVHGARTAGVYKSDDDKVIMSSDVTSFYPNLAIRNEWSPAHLPKGEFCDLYEWFFTERKKIPKSNPMNYVYKIILNSTYGLSNDENSFLYDPEFTMRVTVNGQLSLMMLYEMVMTGIPEAFSIMHNTDGIETLILRKYIPQYMEICKEWEKITSLNLEHDTYEQLILADVNNYIGIHEYKKVEMALWREMKVKNPHYLFRVKDNKFYYASTKCKGRFEFNNLQLHKNKSKLVIPKAIYNYFVKGVLPEDYLNNNKNILDYCIGGKSKGDWKMVARYIEKQEPNEDRLQKINRYYISNEGKKIIKVNSKDRREIQLEAGKWMQTIYNKMEIKSKWTDYNVNTNYYLCAIEKELDNIIGIDSNQLTLFN